MSDERWFELLPCVEHEVWAEGVGTRAVLVEIQAANTIPIFGPSPWPAQYLRRDAAFDFLAMKRAAAEQGVSLWVRYGWRDHALQERFYAEWRAGKRNLRPAQPGWSKHENGLAVDISRAHDDPDGDGPAVGPTDQWLIANAARFNFSQTVPAERWHYEHRRA